MGKVKRGQFIDITPEFERGKNVIGVQMVTNRGTDNYFARWRVPMRSRPNKRNPYVFKSLQTDDIAKAKKKAWDWYKKKSAEIANGEPLFMPSFKEVAEKYIQKMQADTKKRDKAGKPVQRKTDFERYKGVITRYLIPYFGDYRIDKIPQEKLRGYVSWREDYYYTGPGKNQEEVTFERDGKTMTRPLVKRQPAYTTIQKDLVAFNKIIEYAMDYEKVTFIEGAPEIKKKRRRRSEQSRRPHFDDDEVELLIVELGNRVFESTSEETKRARRMLYCLCGIMLYTGIRAAEMYRMKWGHIQSFTPEAEKLESIEKINRGELFHLTSSQKKHMSEEEVAKAEEKYEDWNERRRFDLALDKEFLPEVYKERLDIYEQTVEKFEKTNHFYKIFVPSIKDAKHYRYVTADSRIKPFILALQAHYMDPVYKKIVGDVGPGNLPQDMYLFCHPDGRRINRKDQMFTRALNQIKSPKHPKGLRRNLEGRERTLTSFRHTYATRQLKRGITVYALAKQMGTSVKMIEQYYGHVTPDDFAAQFL